jgi:arylformamidase
MSEFDLSGHSSQRDATEALRDVFAEIFSGMGREGAGPHHMVRAAFLSDEPERFHMARHEVELAWREAFAGFRPPITLAPSARAGLTVTVTFKRAAAPDPAIATLAAEYSPRRQTDMTALFRRWSAEGRAFCRDKGGLDLAYGPGAWEKLDLFRPAGRTRPPVWVFIHGGYWQASDKVQHAQFAAGMVQAGYAVAMPNYGLAPDTPLETILAQTIASLQFLVTNQDALGIDASRLHLSGHSAGGHLAAMVATEPGAPPIESALLLSGLFDLEPLGRIPLGRLLGLDDPARAKALSPIHRPAPKTRIALAYGARETAAFADQSARLAAAWGAPAPLAAADAHHFNLLEPLATGGELLDLARSLAGPA